MQLELSQNLNVKTELIQNYNLNFGWHYSPYVWVIVLNYPKTSHDQVKPKSATRSGLRPWMGKPEVDQKSCMTGSSQTEVAQTELVAPNCDLLFIRSTQGACYHLHNPPFHQQQFLHIII